VIEPANPQVVYVPQYNTTTVYTQAPASTTVIVESDNTDEVIAAGMIGFTAGIAMSAWSNPYYYGPYGWYGGAYMYNDAWDDYYDAREDAREDWMDHREDIADERGDRVDDRGDRARDTQQQRTEQRTERQGNRQENRPESQTQRQQRSTETTGGLTADGHRAHAERRIPRLHPAPESAAQRAERPQLGRVLRVLEQPIDTVDDSARRSEPQQRRPVARRRRTAALNGRDEQHED
jgi:hypothetical protein